MSKFSGIALALIIAALVSLIPNTAVAQTGAGAYASQMDNRGFFRHDRGFNGAEVIYRNGSGYATKADAMRAWRDSPGHNALLRAGAIQDIQCRGGVCVGRGYGSSSGGGYGGGGGDRPVLRAIARVVTATVRLIGRIARR